MTSSDVETDLKPIIIIIIRPKAFSKYSFDRRPKGREARAVCIFYVPGYTLEVEDTNKSVVK